MRQTIPRQSKRQFLGEIYRPIKNDLLAVETLLRSELDRTDIPWMEQLLQHTSLAGGKRMRPALVLLSGQALGQVTSAHHRFAASLEMIHTATLIHDDVLDNAETRRHQPTINAKWNNKTSVLLGDYLFTHSFYVASQAGALEQLKRLAVASNRVCEGEMKQNAWCGNFEINEDQYLDLVSLKTAELCGFACQIGAELAGASTDDARQFEQFGMDLGIAFQIIDDILDIVGQSNEVGKTLGTDLLNQKPTLAVIHCLEQLEPTTRGALLDLLNGPQPKFVDVLPYLEQTKSVEYARTRARMHAQKSLQFAEQLPLNDAASSLKAMAEFVLERSS